MNKSKSPIIIANWRGNVSDLNEAKNILKNIDKEYSLLLKAKNKALKRKPVKKDLSFYLSLPSLFIYPMQAFIKENKTLKNIIVGAQNFDEIEKTNKNAKTTFSQIKSVGAKFVLLNDEYNNIENNQNNKYKEIIEKEEINVKKSNNKNNTDNTANSILLERLNNVSKKFEDKEKIQNIKNDIDLNLNDEEKEVLKKINIKELQNLEEKVKISLSNNMLTILVIQKLEEDLNLLIDFIKKIIKNIHYNLFNNLIICYETEKSLINIDQTDIEDCQEKVIAIRRTIANMFGIDNAKKVKMLFSGKIDETNIINILENGGVDGILLAEETIYPKSFAKILTEII